MTDAPELPAELQPPMANGEVLFSEPWQGRVFGMAIALHEAGVFQWAEFQQALIRVINAWQQAHPGAGAGAVTTADPAAAGQAGAETEDSDPAAEYRYYEHFQNALADVLEARGVVSALETDQLAQTFAQRPHGHDHSH